MKWIQLQFFISCHCGTENLQYEYRAHRKFEGVAVMLVIVTQMRIEACRQQKYARMESE